MKRIKNGNRKKKGKTKIEKKNVKREKKRKKKNEKRKMRNEKPIMKCEKWKLKNIEKLKTEKWFQLKKMNFTNKKKYRR